MFANVILLASLGLAQETAEQPLPASAAADRQEGRPLARYAPEEFFRWCSLKARRDHLEQELPKLTIRHILSVVSFLSTAIERHRFSELAVFYQG